MSNIRFKCTVESVQKLYSLFDCLYGRYRESLDKGKSIVAEDTDITLRGYFQDSSLYEASNIVGIEFNNSYMYSMYDVIRSSEDYGVVGNVKSYSNSEYIFAPKSQYRFYDICEVRPEYRGIITNRYEVKALPESLKDLNKVREYKELSYKYRKDGLNVNCIFEDKGSYFCGNISKGYKDFFKLEGVEKDLYETIVEGVLELGFEVNRVYFYSDLSWSRVLVRESRSVVGEYEVVLK